MKRQITLGQLRKETLGRTQSSSTDGPIKNLYRMTNQLKRPKGFCRTSQGCTKILTLTRQEWYNQEEHGPKPKKICMPTSGLAYRTPSKHQTRQHLFQLLNQYALGYLAYFPFCQVCQKKRGTATVRQGEVSIADTKFGGQPSSF